MATGPISGAASLMALQPTTDIDKTHTQKFQTSSTLALASAFFALHLEYCMIHSKGPVRNRTFLLPPLVDTAADWKSAATHHG